MLSIATGHDIGYLTSQVAQAREGYYADAVLEGEPPGRWHGAGAAALGLTGDVDAELMEAVFTHLLDPRDPATHTRATWGQAEPLAAGHRAYRSAQQLYDAAVEREPHADPERRAELRAQAERSARQAVSFFDVTFSPPKSVSVLAVAYEKAAADARAAGDTAAERMWAAKHAAVEHAVMVGARAALDYLQDVAGYSRAGHHGGGAGRWVDAHQFVVAQFLQHDSRDRDPQLHVHQAILNRVFGVDGVWRTLDSRALHRHRGAAGAVGERAMEADLAQSEAGVITATRPDGRAREIVGVSEAVCELFSARRRAITPKLAELVTAFRERYGWEPSALDRTRLSQQATLATRSAKSHGGETAMTRLDRWAVQCRNAVAGGLSAVLREVAAATEAAGPAASWSATDVAERALAAVGETRAGWRRADLLRAVSDQLPGHLGLPPEQVRELLDRLTDQALRQAVRLTPAEDTAGLPAELRRADGSSQYADASGPLYATAGQLAADAALREAAVLRTAQRITVDDANAAVHRLAEQGAELGADQRAALVGVCTSGADVETLCAPAGTGKSFLVGALAEAWQHDSSRRVFGLATAQAATEVLSEEGLAARNTAKWLTGQQRLEQGRPVADDEAFALRRGDLVVLDEASMAETAAIVDVRQRCQAAGAKLLLVGDPRQLAAVGAGGTLADLAEHAVRYELAEVRRFVAPWEAGASLALRNGDTAAVGEYHKNGRLVDGGTVEHAEAGAARGWLADHLAGRDTMLLVGSNNDAARVSSALRAELVALGRVAEDGVPLGMQSTIAGVGDLIETRRNAYHLAGHDAPRNRWTYRVHATRADGGLDVARVHGHVGGVEQLGAPITLPGWYVAEHVALGYAATVHSAQGRTVDTCHAVIGPGTDPAAAYVAMSRGRDRNTAHVITRAVPEDSPPGQASTIEPRAASAVFADVIGRDSHSHDGERSALAQQEQATEYASSTQVALDRLAAEVATATAGRTGAVLDRLAADDALSTEHRCALAADPAYEGLERLLRTVELAGHDPACVLETAVTSRGLGDARSPAQVLQHRIRAALAGQLAPRMTSYTDLVPAGLNETTRTRLVTLADAADERRRELGARAAADPPAWALAVLGAVPDDLIAASQWEHDAGWGAAYRELAEHTDHTDPLGPPPPAGLAEKHAAWHAAHAALDLPDGGAQEAAMSDGRLRMRVRAIEREQNWAPRWVGDELAATELAADRHRQDATIWAAHADATPDPAQRDGLRAAAADAQRQAAELAQRAELLHEADEARAGWAAHTAVANDLAARARTTLEHRGVDVDDPDELVTAQQWLEESRAAQHADDPHREVLDEHEFTDVAERRRRDVDQVVRVDPAGAHTEVPDIRDTAVRDAGEDVDPVGRAVIPAAGQVAADVHRAQQALAEITARLDAEKARQADDAARRDELAYWHERDRADRAAADDEAREDELVYQR